MEHKRGDSFDYLATIPESYPDGFFTGWEVKAQVRDARSGALVADLDVQWGDPQTTRHVKLLKIDTSSWSLGQMEFDIQFRRASDGYTLSSSTVNFQVVKDVTKP